ncbi:bombyxin A-3 homolog [Vanessa cardui]|uniref:bombyxin A-3 homolog n=1 Tax=Vanessa cardui TaxID=171605 RepID=UPI001F146963|nr:bombyxin A-3 homolog [Vanessa cardui]
MGSHTVIVLVAVSCFVAAVTSQDYGEVYCGRRLATALALLCNNNLIKKAEPHHGSTHVDFSWPWIEARRAHSLGRRKRQVATECCDKPCTRDELLSYCGN